MSSDDSDDERNATEQLQTWEQLLDRFSSEVHRLSREHVSSHRRLEANLKGHLAVMKRDLSRQLTREVEDLRASLALATQQPKFPLFRKLPVEVRIKIWEYALFSVPRILEIRASFLSRGGQVVLPQGVYHGVYSNPSPTSSYSTLGLGSLAPGSDGSNFGRDFRPVGPPGPAPRPAPPPAAVAVPPNFQAYWQGIPYNYHQVQHQLQHHLHNHNHIHNHAHHHNHIHNHHMNHRTTANPLPGPVIVTNRLPPPALASVCHEARTVALRHGNMYKTKTVEESLFPAAGLSSNSIPPRPGQPPASSASQPPCNQTYLTAYTWFSPSIDYLKLPAAGPSYAVSIITLPDGGLPAPLNIQQSAAQILIRKPQDKPELERQVKRLQSAELFPNLEAIGIVITHDLVRPRTGGWEWGLGTSPTAQLFPTGEGPVRFVDLQSPTTALHIASLFPPNSPPHQVWTTHASSLLSSSNKFTSPLLNNSTFRLEGWEISWLVHRYRKFPLTFPLAEVIDAEDLVFCDEVVRTENGWVKEELKRMPEVRLLHVFVLDEFDEAGEQYPGEKAVEMRRLYGAGGNASGGGGGGGGFGGRLGTLGLV